MPRKTTFQRETTFQSDFSAGELSPLLSGRVDSEKYKKGCKTLLNAVVLPQGPATRRGGTKYLGVINTGSSTDDVRLIPFRHSTGNYVLEFGTGYLRFWKDGALVTSGGSPVEVITPYSATGGLTQLRDLRFDQTETELYLTHKFYPTRILTSDDGIVWTLGFYDTTKGVQNILLFGEPDGSGVSNLAAVSIDKGVTFESKLGTLIPDISESTVGADDVLGCVRTHHGTFAVAVDYASPGYQSILETKSGESFVLRATNIHNNSAKTSSLNTLEVHHTQEVYFYCTHEGDVAVSDGTGVITPLTSWNSISVAATFFKSCVSVKGMGSVNWLLSATDGNVYSVDKVVPSGPADFTAHSTGLGASLGFATFGNGVYLAAGGGGLLSWSTDLVTWTPTDAKQGTNTLGWIAHNGKTGSASLFVLLAGGASLGISTSQDGKTWTSRTSGSTAPARKVVWSEQDKLWYISTASDKFLTSPDGINWTERTIAPLSSTVSTQNGCFDVGSVFPFEASEYPISGSFYQNRLIFGGTVLKPRTIFGSKTNEYDNMTLGTNADEAFEFKLSERYANSIKWLRVKRSLVIGADFAVYLMQPSSLGEAITPTNVNIFKISNDGTALVEPISVDDNTIFVQAEGRKIISISSVAKASEFKDVQKVELNFLANHLTENKVKELTYQQESNHLIWGIKNVASGSDTNNLISAVFAPEHSIIAWSRHVIAGTSPTTGIGADIISVTSVPSTTEGKWDVYLAVRRKINGTVATYMELFQDDFLFTVSDPKDGWYLDSAVLYSGAATKTITGLSHLEGETVEALADGQHVTGLTVAGGQVTLPSAASKVLVGLPFTTDIEIEPLEAGSADGSSQGKIKRIDTVVLRLYKTLGCSVGPDSSNLDQVQFRKTGDKMDSPPPLFTGDKIVRFPAGNTTSASVLLRQSQPFPLTLMGLGTKMKGNN